jgi:pyruvate dehydrogenase E2 component (dihydrolipoamide acetyltransferase)
MPREIKMPKLSDTMEEGTINVWRKREGDSIRKGDVLLEVETDKADMEFEAYMSGTLEKVLVETGATVPVGTPIAIVRLETDSDQDMAAFLAARGQAPLAAPTAPAASPAAALLSAAPTQGAAPTPSTPREVSRRPAPAKVAAPPLPLPPPTEPLLAAPAARSELGGPPSHLPFLLPDPDRVRATPRARIVAQEKAVDLSEIAGSGPDGAVLVSDVERYLEGLENQHDTLLEGDIHATPVAVRIAEELRVDLARVKGTGPGGRVTKRDLRAHLEREAREGPPREAELFGDEIKLSQKRKFLIRNMVESKKTAPHFYISMDVDSDPMRALRERLRVEGKHITYTHMIVKAAALALERFPDVNATFRSDRLVRFNPVNIAVAVDVQEELVAPVVKNCQGRDLEDLAQAMDALIRKAREKKLQPDDYSDGTFTVSNLGMFGVENFYAIITPPQSTVLSVGAVRQVALADSDEIRVGRRMTFGLAVDHRVLDGVKAAQFLAGLKRILEHPDELLASNAAHGA